MLFSCLYYLPGINQQIWQIFVTIASYLGYTQSRRYRQIQLVCFYSSEMTQHEHSKMLQNLPYFWSKKTHIIFFRFSFHAMYFIFPPNECQLILQSMTIFYLAEKPIDFKKKFFVICSNTFEFVLKKPCQCHSRVRYMLLATTLRIVNYITK